jgi:deoxyinosine 3'endonuclease (endonuclease V)
VAGIDVGFEGGDHRAAVVVYVIPTKLQRPLARRPTSLYIPIALSRRAGCPGAIEAEGPAHLLMRRPGHAHPRRRPATWAADGIATWREIVSDRTAASGSASWCEWQPLVDAGEVIGAALRLARRQAAVYLTATDRLESARLAGAGLYQDLPPAGADPPGPSPASLADRLGLADPPGPSPGFTSLTGWVA